jgi:hypothetical protein
MGFRLLLSGILAVAVSAAAPAQDKKDAAGFPKFDDVTKAVNEHFAQQAGYIPGDVLSHGNVRPVFAKIERLGWKVADRQQILELVPPDSDYLVVTLRSRAGLKTMRKIGLLPMSYDYLDRIRAMPHGAYRVRELVEGPDGYKMIEYMATTKYGLNLTKQLTKAKNGQDFTKPTGRIYNEPQFLARLKASYDAEAARRGIKPGNTPAAKGPAAKAPSAKTPPANAPAAKEPAKK